MPNGLAFSRLGLAISRKIGSAVARNRIKRRFREAVRRQLIEKPLQYDIVIVARHASAEAEFSELDKKISRILSGLAHEKTIDSGNKII